ncbi:MAG: ketol-acid reductoisomerase [Candidatus Eisenbacteria bacterium]|nr:ketol-acid reductoisomerase [Candidatus Latescibacterota bacterium]MBD3301307.1 ketol-acid reductoisomerase [Candidatus Eisenbacteria bacterium]
MQQLETPIGILGYGNQGRAQAGNLRDAGLEVYAGGRPGGPSAEAAARDGFAFLPTPELADRCALVALLTPDETHGTILAQLAGGASVRTLVLAHGFSLRFEDPDLHPSWDVVLVAPSGPGTALRTPAGAGRIGALIGVHRDRSGRALEKARAYATAAGCAPEGLIETTVAAEAEIDLFGEQAVLCGGLSALVLAAWETLVERGYDPEIAYLECVHQAALTASMIRDHGIAGMRERISSLALFGDLTRGPRVIGPSARAALGEILEEIRDGRFAGEWAEEVASGKKESRKGLEASRRHAVERARASLQRRPQPPVE